MFTKFFKPITLSFLLTALCVALAIWTIPTGLAGDNEKCSGGVTTSSQQSCSGDKDSCSKSKGHTNRSENYTCVPSTGDHCEIWQKSKAYEVQEWNCKWNASQNRCGSDSTSIKFSGAKLNSCNTTKMSS